MSDHLILFVDRFIRPPDQMPAEVPATPSSSTPYESSNAVVSGKERVNDEEDEGEPLIQEAECRICQEEDSVDNLETPCACSGSLKV